MSRDHRAKAWKFGLQFTGCVSGVAVSSSFHILILLSTSPVIRRSPVWSNVLQYTPASLSRDPDCASVSAV